MDSVFQKPLDDDIKDVAEGMAIVINGDTAPQAISSGQYLFIKNHSTLATGGYHATAAITSGGSVTSSNVAADANGIVNAAYSSLNSNITDLIAIKTYTKSVTLSAGATTGLAASDFEISAPAGYSIVGIVGWDGNNNYITNYRKIRYTATGNIIFVKNNDSSSVTTNINVVIMFAKTDSFVTL